MKLVNFYKSERLNSLLEKMGAKLVKIQLSSEWTGIDDNKLAELLRTGEVEIEIEDIEISDSVFEYKGQKVIVYIRDQYSKYYSKGYKFHLTKCSTITKAFQNKRNSRYVISLRTDGQFKINLINGNVIEKKDLIEKLNVCKNCLNQINYKGYNTSYYNKQNVYNNFDLSEYFSQFSKSNLNPNLFNNNEIIF